MDKALVAKAFNEWMRRYIDEPERFTREMVTVLFLEAESAGREPNYGESCASYLEQLMAEVGG